MYWAVSSIWEPNLKTLTHYNNAVDDGKLLRG